jgi:hypothetical protein
VLWERESREWIEQVVLDRGLRFVGISSKWALRVYRLKPDLSLGELLLDTRDEDYGVRGMTWVKNGLVFWGVKGIRTPDEEHFFPGDHRAHYKTHGKTYHWDMRAGTAKLIFPDIVTNAIADPSGKRVAIFGRGLEQQAQHVEGGPPDETIYLGKFEVLDLTTGSVSLVKWIDAWSSYAYRQVPEVGAPRPLFWTAGDVIFLIARPMRKIRLGSDQFGPDRPLLMTLDLKGTLNPLTDVDANVARTPPEPVLLGDGKTVMCMVSGTDPNRDRRLRIAYFTNEGMTKESLAYETRERPDYSHTFTFTPDGHGALFQDYAPPDNDDREIWAWNWDSRTYYRLGRCYYIGWTQDGAVGGWATDHHFAFAAARRADDGRTLYIPGVLQIEKDADATPLGWSDWLESIGRKPPAPR